MKPSSWLLSCTLSHIRLYTLWNDNHSVPHLSLPSPPPHRIDQVHSKTELEVQQTNRPHWYYLQWKLWVTVMDTHYLLLLSATVCISTFVYLYLYFIPFTLTHHLPYTPCYFTIEQGLVHLVRVRERVSHKPFTLFCTCSPPRGLLCIARCFGWMEVPNFHSL